MKDDLRYTPSDCFETFPFPEGWEHRESLERVGREYYEFRAELMTRVNQGSTKVYNRFNDPQERTPDLLRLRELHAEMDRAVLDVYGWTDISPINQFELEFELDRDHEEGSRRRKAPWRYRWPDETRDEVLARLLDLNRRRAIAETISGEAQFETANVSHRQNQKRGKTSPRSSGLFVEENQ